MALRFEFSVPNPELLLGTAPLLLSIRLLVLWRYNSFMVIGVTQE